jgi:acyl carrier protein
MQSNGVIESISRYILEKFPLARKRALKSTDLLLENGILDSMGIFDLVEFIETEFGIRIEDDDLLPENFQSVERIEAFVESRRLRAEV